MRRRIPLETKGPSFTYNFSGAIFGAFLGHQLGLVPSGLNISLIIGGAYVSGIVIFIFATYRLIKRSRARRRKIYLADAIEEIIENGGLSQYRLVKTRHIAW
eukprot:Blabericola_migrator_1__3986@NODE_2209_length_3119_cov_87_495085_g1391_i0_p8_GENE_NODE_2209_length_3119_cov_87_495085_g1391_i0NODE_2209_length_3119_cov_87_495085_g1391_i0_p8_ORF_typecomplete_len102_score8_35DUF3487/PF11990_8/0_0031COX14/PF14880_6/0_098DUF1180/PF06679_12/0_097LapA_dom/PF06305_11/1_1e03LapA_dom/PF06305_11/2_8_NODE_2209_length_3119_cov_87_495085_g1391_i0467772